MLTHLDVFGGPGVPQLTLPIIGSGDSPLQIKPIDGLSPVKANVNTSPYGVIPGEAITGTSVGKRNIVLTFGLNPDWSTQTIEELRKQLYKYFMPQLSVTLQFTSTHLPLCAIDGVVESMDTNMFSKDPEVAISIICGRPEFVAVEETIVDGTVKDEMITKSIDYSGSLPTGVTIEINKSAVLPAYNGPVTVQLVRELGSENFVVDNVAINAVKAFRLSSVPGSKYVRNISTPVGDGTTVNLLGRVENGYVWPQLRPGINEFGVRATSPGPIWTLSYFAKFGGL